MNISVFLLFIIGCRRGDQPVVEACGAVAVLSVAPAVAPFAATVVVRLGVALAGSFSSRQGKVLAATAILPHFPDKVIC